MMMKKPSTISGSERRNRTIVVGAPVVLFAVCTTLAVRLALDGPVSTWFYAGGGFVAGVAVMSVLAAISVPSRARTRPPNPKAERWTVLLICAGVATVPFVEHAARPVQAAVVAFGSGMAVVFLVFIGLVWSGRLE